MARLAAHEGPASRTVPRRRTNPVQRFIAALRRPLTMKLSSSRRISADERDAVARKIASDPEVEWALTRLLAARPQYRSGAANGAGVRDRFSGR
jgi:hypothetical protein